MITGDSSTVDVKLYCIVVRYDTWNYLSFFEFVKACFMS